MLRRLVVVLAAVAVALGAASLAPADRAAAAITVDLVASSTEVECGRSVILTAVVRDDGVAVPNGTDVTFAAAGQVIAVVDTVSGVASVLFTVPVGFAGPLVVTATVGSASDSVTITVTCPTAGPPASITLLITPATITCGSQASVFATVRDQFGRLVANNTMIEFVASGNGSIVPVAPTISGVATAVYTAFPGTSGLVQITARAAGTTVTATGTVQVVCPTAATPTRPPATAVPPTPIPTTPSVIRPPSTGDAGLAD
ncbi:MAG TPA: hypothetical protein VNN10_12810 [Dehalococcoidia bacterium]|nr:hypothetical protein [Dehalococcoidia bacterium]